METSAVFLWEGNVDCVSFACVTLTVGYRVLIATNNVSILAVRFVN